MARKTSHSLMNSPRTVADKAIDTWNELSSTLETAVGRTQSAAHDAQETLRDTRKNAKSSVRKARADAEKTVKNARKTVKNARKETGRRTTGAKDALAGRAPRRGWTILAGLIGVGIGAAVGAIGARLARRSDIGERGGEKLHDAMLSDTTSASAGSTSATPVVADRPPVIATTPSSPVPTAVPTTPQATAPQPTTAPPEPATVPTPAGASSAAKPGSAAAATADKASKVVPSPRSGTSKPPDDAPGNTSVNGSSSS